MEYRSQEYFYYFLRDDVNFFRDYDSAAGSLIDLLGDFSLPPFSLKFVNSEKGAYIVCDDFKLENRGMEKGSLWIDRLDGSFVFTGVYCDDSIIRLFVRNNYDDDSTFGLQFSIVNDNEMIFYSSDMDNYNNRLPGYAYYDEKVISSLKAAGNLLSDIVAMTPRDIEKFGIKPDVFSFTDFEELGFDSQKDFASKLLKDLSYEDLKERFKNIDTDKEVTVKFKKNLSSFGPNYCSLFDGRF